MINTTNMSAFESLVRWNMRICDRLTPSVEYRTHPYPQFDQFVANFLNSHEGITLVDIGAGRHCDYSDRVVKRPRRVVGVDISGDELARNPFLDEQIEADACTPLPHLDGEADLLVSKATQEHLRDNAAFLENAARILKPGGMLVLVFTNRYAPFAFINRLLPEKVSSFLLDKPAPTWRGQVGFKTFYDRTNYSAFRQLLVQAGYRDINIKTGYFSSAYFRFFVPLYLLSLGFDLIRHTLRIKDFGSYYLVTARTPEKSETRSIGGEASSRQGEPATA